MDLEERIARLIAPYAIWTEPSRDSDSRDWLDWYFLQPNRERSIEAARRVIDGLHLKETELMTFRGPVKGIIKGHIDQEDQS